MNDALAEKDARALLRFLQGRGYISASAYSGSEIPDLKREATSLSDVDMVEVSLFIFYCGLYLPSNYLFCTKYDLNELFDMT